MNKNQNSSFLSKAQLKTKAMALGVFLLAGTVQTANAQITILNGNLNAGENPTFINTFTPMTNASNFFPTSWRGVTNHNGTADYFKEGHYMPNSSTTYFPTPVNPYPDAAKGVGGGFIGIASGAPANLNSMEYWVATLSAPMVAGTNYRLKFYMRHDHGSTTLTGVYTSIAPDTRRMGLLFTTVAPSVTAASPGRLAFPLSYFPANRVYIDAAHPAYTATHQWVLVELDYIAQGGEQYMTFGNYHVGPITLTAHPTHGPGDIVYFYADNFSIEELVLPVVFGPVAATLNSDALNLSWSTNSETNNSHFEVEASADGKTFTKIGTVQSKATNGNSDTVLNYAFTKDAARITLGLGLGLLAIGGIGFNRRKRAFATIAVVAGLSLSITACQKGGADAGLEHENLFIRIAQIDKDGTKTYSQVVKAVRK